MIEKLFGAKCDRCGQTTGGIGTTKEVARQQSALLGWVNRYPNYDYCPPCAKDRREKEDALRPDQWILPDGTVMSNKSGNPKD